jgi:iron complex outermembrane receptor protein
MAKRWWLPLIALVPVPAMAEDQEPQDLSNLSIEELAQIPVRSASKQEEPLSSAPTSLFVITDTDIARSTATSLPEVLRAAPNLIVQRINAHDYSVSARGFAGYETSNKLLVLIDGRSIYSTLHSGVFWELRSPLIEDIKQIEVISGPGGTLYGPNAVNGVVSITSRDARETLGVLARGTAGGRERTLGARYGTAIGSNAAIRVSANYFDRENQPDGLGPDFNDNFRGWQASLRADAGSDSSHFSLQGNIFDNQTFAIPGDGNHGQNIVARWNGALSETTSLQVQGYYDYFKRRLQLATDALETFDLDTQLNKRVGSHALVAGFGIRTTKDLFINKANPFVLDPQGKRLWIFNGYVQDRVGLTHNLSLTAGVKLEQSTFSGLEVLPNLRLSWRPSDEAMIWGAVSRAVRTPSRIDRNLTFPGLLDRAVDFKSEKLTALEAGIRGQPSSSTSISISLFYNLYDDLRSARPVNGTGLPLVLANQLGGQNYGLEIWGSHQLTPWWRLNAGLSLLKERLGVDRGATDVTNTASLGDDPPYQFLARSSFDLAQGVTLDLSGRAVGKLERGTIPAYVEADARLGWMVTDRVELYAAGTNLLHRSHAESGDPNRAQLAERSIVAGARLRF